MAYQNGKNHLTKSQKLIRTAIRKKDINLILWKLIEECFMDLELNQEPRHGKDFMRFAIQQVAIMEGKKGKVFSPDETFNINELTEWAGGHDQIGEDIDTSDNE